MQIDKHPFERNRKLNVAATGFVFILVGIVIMARNVGLISDDLQAIIISWPMLLVVIGFVSLIKRNYIGALCLFTVGAFFLIPRIFEVEGNWIRDYWPVLLVMIGVIMLFKLWLPDNHWSWENRSSEEVKTEEGYVTADVSFGGARYIVLDPEFKGAKLNVAFGSIALDLRRTSLPLGETVITVEDSFSNIVIYLPSNWNVLFEVNASFSSCEDKRSLSHLIDLSRKLVIRGNIAFGGLDIKN